MYQKIFFFTTDVSFQDLVVGIPSSHNCKGLGISLVVILTVIGLVAFTGLTTSCILSATFYYMENVPVSCILNYITSVRDFTQDVHWQYFQSSPSKYLTKFYVTNYWRSFITYLVFLMTPEDLGPRIRGERMTLDNFTSNMFQPTKFNATWQKGKCFTFIN